MCQEMHFARTGLLRWFPKWWISRIIKNEIKISFLFLIKSLSFSVLCAPQCPAASVRRKPHHDADPLLLSRSRKILRSLARRQWSQLEWHQMGHSWHAGIWPVWNPLCEYNTPQFMSLLKEKKKKVNILGGFHDTSQKSNNQWCFYQKGISFSFKCHKNPLFFFFGDIYFNSISNFSSIYPVIIQFGTNFPKINDLLFNSRYIKQ